VSWRAGRDEQSCSVRDLAQQPFDGIDPLRGFSWRRGQRHRPGLQYLVSTGRHHGFESLEEARLLLAMDFAGGLIDVVSQPLKIGFGSLGGRVEHTPDYLAVTRFGVWLVDVRPEARIRKEDRVKFAAGAEVALACGWGVVLAARWRENVVAVLDALSSQRRPLADPLGLRAKLLDLAEAGPVAFGDLAAAAGCEPVARAQLLHLLWHRELGVALTEPLADRSLVVHPGRRVVGS
jgi:hypothetical protein